MRMSQNDKLVYDYILVRYGELTTKGKNRGDFTKRLLQNTKNALKEFDKLTYERTHDRMYIHLHGEDGELVKDKVKDIFGISSFSLALKVDSDLDQIVERSFDLIQNCEGETFKVVARRGDKNFPHRSDAINRAVATKILSLTEWRVDVHNPDVRLEVEVRRDATYLMADKTPGAGGYPVGVGGKSILMLSGGIDSPVAGYMTMKRGVYIECIHFASPPYTSAAAQEKVVALARKLANYQGHVRIHVVPFTELQLEIYKHCNESYAITIMRRMMYRLGDELCKKQKAVAIVNGESLGQVASQTLESMLVINDVTNRPVLRPLVAMDKLEIIGVSKKIDCYDISIQPFEDCCTIFTPKNPVTKPNLEKARKMEEAFDYEALIQKCIDNIEVIDVYPSNDEIEEDLF